MRQTFRYVVVTPPRPGERITLAERDAHHLTRVVRRRVGDAVELIDGEGRIWPATVAELDDGVAVEVGEPRQAHPPSGLTLYQGLAEWGRIDTLAEKGGELGLDRLVMFRSARAQRIPEPDAWRRRRMRLRCVSEAAARQSGQGYVPRVEGLMEVEDALAEAGRDGGYLVDPGGDRLLVDVLAQRPAPLTRAALVVGPEAGFSADELAWARDAGLSVCRLGPAVLRAETAALVAMSLVLAASGRLGGG